MLLKKISMLIVLLVVVFITLILACGKKADEAEVGERVFPKFRFSSSDGNTYTEKDIEKGVTVAGFMVSWCAPCTGELKTLNKLKDEFAAKKLQVLVFTYEDFSKYDSLKTSLGIDLAIVQADSSLFSSLGIDAIPTRILLNNGRQIKRIIGAPSFEEEEFYNELAELLGVKTGGAEANNKR